VMTAINRGIPIAAVEGGKNLQKNLMDFANKLTGKMLRPAGHIKPIAKSGAEEPAKPNSQSVLKSFGFFNKNK
jgi:hypothetical protein